MDTKINYEFYEKGEIIKKISNKVKIIVGKILPVLL